MAKFDKFTPFNKLPRLPSKHDVESREILKYAIRAHRALAVLNTSIKLLKESPRLLYTLSLLEAAENLAFSGLPTDKRRIFEADPEKSFSEDPSLDGIFLEREALWEAFERLSSRTPLNVEFLVNLFHGIRGRREGIRNTSGFQILASGSNEVIYTAPEGEKIILEKLENLEDYIQEKEDETETLVRLAIIHLQFWAIHPFADGNGRISRILVPLFLKMNDLLDAPAFYLTQYLVTNKETYFRLRMRAIAEDKWKQWVLFILKAIEASASFTSAKIESIFKSMQQTRLVLTRQAPEIYSVELLELIYSHPICKRKFLEDAGIVKKKTAGIYLSTLEKLGTLTSTKAGKEKHYVNGEMMNILVGE